MEDSNNITELAELVFKGGIKPPGSIQLDLSECSDSHQSSNSVVQEILMTVLVYGLKLLHNTVDPRELSEKQWESTVEHYKAIGWEPSYKIVQKIENGMILYGYEVSFNPIRSD